jgi:hypothetical protein
VLRSSSSQHIDSHDPPAGRAGLVARGVKAARRPLEMCCRLLSRRW